MSNIEQQKTCDTCNHFLRSGFCSIYFNSLRAFGDVRVNKDTPACKYYTSEIEDKNCKLFVSFNLGATYLLTYQCNDDNDEILKEYVKHCNENLIRFYIEYKDKPEKHFVSDIHKKTIAFLNEETIDSGNSFVKINRTSIPLSEQVNRLKEKFCKKV